MIEDERHLYRHRDDKAYLEASRDDLLRHQLKVGHSFAWIEVLGGNAPGIVLPTVPVDEQELDQCRRKVIALHGRAAPETPYDEEFNQYLTHEQLQTLKAGKPVIMMCFVERQFDLDIKRKNTDLQNRVRDSISFGMALALQYLGRLMAKPDVSLTKTVDGAVRDAAELISVKWWPEAGRLWTKKPPKIPKKDRKKKGARPLTRKECRKPPIEKSPTPITDEHERKLLNERVDPLMELHRTGVLSDRRALFMMPEAVEKLIKEDVLAAEQSDETHNLERRFWYSTAAGLLRCNLQDGEQASAQRSISEALQHREPVPRYSQMQYLGVTKTHISPADLVALAFFKLSDVHRLFPVHQFYFPDFEAATILGELSRYQVARIDSKTAERLTKLLAQPIPAATHISRTRVPPTFTHEQFLRYAMARIGSDVWWTQVLKVTPNNFGIRYIWRGMHAPRAEDFQSCWYWETIGDVEPLGSLQREVNKGYIVQFRKPVDARIWKCPPSPPDANVAVVDRRALLEYCRNDESAWAEVLVFWLALRMRFEGDKRYEQTMTPLLPGYYLTLTRIASATLVFMRTYFPERSVRSELDLEYYSRFLTKREFDMMRNEGELTGCAILTKLGHDKTEEIAALVRKMGQEGSEFFR